MSRAQPIEYVWHSGEITDAETGETYHGFLVPTERCRKSARQQNGADGSLHVLAPFESRNMNMHRACFAELNDLYNNLPETVWYRTDADGKFVLNEFGEKEVRFPSVEHFRYWLLIEEGVCNEWYLDAKNERAARAAAGRLRVRLVHARIKVDYDHKNETWMVVVREAKSQEVGSMPAAEFKDSMEKILARARSYVGVTATISRRNAGRAA